MYRSSLVKTVRSVGSRRVALSCRVNSKTLVHRTYSSSSHDGASSQNGGSLLYLSLSAAAAMSAIYFIYPFEKKPAKKPEPKVEEESQPTQDQQSETESSSGDANEENVQSEAPEESTSSSQDTSDAVNGNAEETAAEQPEKEDTVTSTDGHQSNKEIKSDAEIQKVEEEQLAPTDKEAEQEGAYNPDTGEINWDCPCLGGMAHGPCGEEFKAAFSCFVYSEAEPKGIDCVEKFQNMQDCFRKYPEYYAEQIKDEEEATATRGEEISAAKAGKPAKEGTQAESKSVDKQTSSETASSKESIPSKEPESLATTSSEAESNKTGAEGKSE